MDGGADVGAKSLPSRERELKLPCGGFGSRGFGSLPSRERELKLWYMRRGLTINAVAPLAGARIETESEREIALFFKVAPLAGARIETPAISKRAGAS